MEWNRWSEEGKTLLEVLAILNNRHREEVGKLERELNEANADKLRLREALKKFEYSAKTHQGRPMCPECLCISSFDEEHKDHCVFMALEVAPPPVVAKEDADALADALKEACAYPVTGDWWNQANDTLKAYRDKYKEAKP